MPSTTRFKNPIRFEAAVTMDSTLSLAGVLTIDALYLQINANAAAATNEDPYLSLLGGDGGAEIIQTRWLQDSSADLLALEIFGGAAGATEKSPTLVLGVPGTTTVSMDSTLRLEASSDAGVNRPSTIVALGEERRTTITASNNLRLSDGTAYLDLLAGALTESALASMNLSVSGAAVLTGGASMNVGDDVATWTFDGAGGLSETAMTTFSLTPSSTVDIDAGGAVTIDSSAAAISIGGDAVAQALNLGTAGARAILVGSATAASLGLDAGIGAGSFLADTTMTVQGGGISQYGDDVAKVRFDGAGALSLTGVTTLDLDASGAASLESSAGAINVGADAVAQALNLGTAGARVISLGSSASASLALDAGVGALSLLSDVSSTWQLSGNQVGNIVLTLDAINAGAGEGRLALNADDQVNINDGICDLQFDAGVVTEAAMVSIDITPSGTMTLRGGGVSIFGDDVAGWSFDGAGALTQSGLTSAVINPSGALTLTSGTSATWQLSGTDAGALTLTIDANNAGAGTGVLTLAAKSTINIGDAGNPAIAFAGSGAVTAAGNPTWNFGTSQADFGGNVNANAGVDVTGNLTLATGVATLTANGASSLTTSAGALTITGAASSTWQVSGTSAGDIDLTVDANNAGAGASDLVLTAKTQVRLGDAGNPTIDLAGSGAVSASGNPAINLGTGVLTLGGTSLLTTAAMQWTMLDANGASLSFGSAGDLSMLVFDTTEAAEVLIFGAALGARFNDSIPLRFGTPGTDVVFTPDGTDLVVTETGDFVFADSADMFFGGGKDLGFVHNGTNNIVDHNTGELIFQIGTRAITFDPEQGGELKLAWIDSGIVAVNIGGAATTITLNVPSGAVLVCWDFNVTTTITGIDSTTGTLAMSGGSTLTLGTIAAFTQNTKNQGVLNYTQDNSVTGGVANAAFTLSGGGDNTPSAGAIRMKIAYLAVSAQDNA